MNIFKAILVLAGLACAAASCTAQLPTTKLAGKPNIIYILADDLGYGDLSCYGQKHFSTPTLDSLAAHGIRFVNHYAGSPVCSPSRASLVTGRDPGHSRVRGNYENGPFGFGAGLELRPQDPTVAEVLKKAGYSTALVGKWGLGMNGTTGAPNKKGFDYFYGFLNQAHAHYHFPDYLYRNTEKIVISENKDGNKGKFSSDLFTGETLAFLDRQSTNKPFFLYLSYITPHAEMVVPEDALFESFKGRFNETPFIEDKQGTNGKNSFGAYGSQAYPAAAYATMVVRLDRDIKKIVEHLKSRGLSDNTIIMFSSDNGPHKEGGANPAIFQSSAGLRGAKRDVYEGGIRVPFIVNWPAAIQKGFVSDHISAFWDMMPTFAELAGVNLQKEKVPTEGISIVPTLLSRPNQKQHRYLYWEFHEKKEPDQALRIGKWKGVRKGVHSAIELYDLSVDKGEERNLAKDHPQTVKIMEGILETAREPHELWPLNKTSK